MAILSITRDWGPNPSIVRIVTSDTLATILADGYLTTQLEEINAVNFGDFQWRDTDYVLIAYSGGEGFFGVDLVNMAFTAVGAQQAIVHLTTAQIFGMSAAPVLIVPSPGVNKAALSYSINGVYVHNTTQFAAGGAIGLEYGNTAALAGPAASTTLAAATFNGYAASNLFELTPDVTDTAANIANMGLYISNTVGAFTTGDGSLIINVGYHVVPTA